MATWVEVLARSQSPRASSSSVVVPNVRISLCAGPERQSGGGTPRRWPCVHLIRSSADIARAYDAPPADRFLELPRLVGTRELAAGLQTPVVGCPKHG